MQGSDASFDIMINSSHKSQHPSCHADLINETSFPCFCWRTLPSWIPSTSPMGCCVAGGLEVGAGLVRGGHQHASGVRLITVPPIQACWQYAWCLACVESCPLWREGSMTGGQIVYGTYRLMPWRSSFPGHRMCCGHDDPLWVVCSICLSGLLRRLRLAMIDRHVSLLHATKKRSMSPILSR